MVVGAVVGAKTIDEVLEVEDAMDPEEEEVADAMDLEEEEEEEEEATIVTATARGDMAAEEVGIVVFPETGVIVMTFNKKMSM